MKVMSDVCGFHVIYAVVRSETKAVDDGAPMELGLSSRHVFQFHLSVCECERGSDAEFI